MSFDPAPQEFFGPGYSEASAAITLKASDATGTTTGTTVDADNTTDTLTTAAAHNLKVGDRVQFTAVGTLPTGISAATDYWVLSVPSSTTFTISATNGGTILDITADGSSGDNTVAAFGPLEEVADADIDASSGDSRAVVFALAEMLYQRFLNTPAADRPSKLSITRSSSSNDDAGEITRTYAIQVTIQADAVSVSDE